MQPFPCFLVDFLTFFSRKLTVSYDQVGLLKSLKMVYTLYYCQPPSNFPQISYSPRCLPGSQHLCERATSVQILCIILAVRITASIHYNRRHRTSHRCLTTMHCSKVCIMLYLKTDLLTYDRRVSCICFQYPTASDIH